VRVVAGVVLGFFDAWVWRWCGCWFCGGGWWRDVSTLLTRTRCCCCCALTFIAAGVTDTVRPAVGFAPKKKIRLVAWANASRFVLWRFHYRM